MMMEKMMKPGISAKFNILSVLLIVSDGNRHRCIRCTL